MKRSWIVCSSVLMLCMVQQSYAWHWRDLWSRPDQQGAQLLKQGHPKKAAQSFRDPAWRGVAHYYSGQYEQALQDFNSMDSAEAHYNRGNTLARLGRYQQAISAYDRAIKHDPKHQDALYNRALIKKLLQKKAQSSRTPPPASTTSKPKAKSKTASASPQQAPSSPPSEPKSAHTARASSERQQASVQPQPKAATKHAQPRHATKTTTQPPSEAKQTQSPAHPQRDVASEQWLRQVPDDPGGLLRQKFLRDHKRQQQKK